MEELFDVIIKTLYHNFKSKDEIQDFILSLSNKIEENDYLDVEVDEDYEITIRDGLQEKSDIRDDLSDEDLVEESNEVKVDADGFYSLK